MIEVVEFRCYHKLGFVMLCLFPARQISGSLRILKEL